MNLKTVDFNQGDSMKNLLKVFVPLLIAYIFNMFYDLMDSFWIGNMLGESALAAQTICIPIILIFNSLCMGATNGISILLSKRIGAKEQKKVDGIIATSFFTLLFIVIVVVIICEFGLDLMLHVLNTPDEIYAAARGYLAIHIVSFPIVLLYMYLGAVLRSYGNSSMQMIAVIICTVLNGILDPVLIQFVGINGAAIATVLTQGIMMLIIVAYIYRKKLIRINIKDFSRGVLKEIAAKSIPAMFQQSIPSISTAFITSIVSTFGILSIAAFGVIGKIEILLLYPAMAMNMALTTASGQCCGRENFKKLKQYLKCGMIVSGGITIIIAPLIAIFSINLSSIFGAGMEAGFITKTYFTIVGVGYVCNCLTNSIIGEINGFGRPTIAMILMVIYYLAIRMPLAKILSIYNGLNGIWTAVLVSHIAALIVALLLQYFVIAKRMKGAQYRSEQMKDIDELNISASE